MTNEKPKGIAFYLGRSLQAIGVTICFLAMFKGANLFVEWVTHFDDSTFVEFASIFPQFLIGMAIAGVGRALTYERDIATRAGGTTINARNIINASGHVSNVAGDSISGHVTNSITQLQVSRDPNDRQLADLLYRLQKAIENDHSLRAADKIDALEQVKVLSEANRNPQVAKIALRTLRGMMAELPTAVTFLEACNKLLPMITKLVGLG